MRQQAEKITAQIKLKAFYAAPLKDDGVSVVNILRDTIGESVGNSKQLLTGPISATVQCNYHGTLLQLRVGDGYIYLNVSGVPTIEPAWRITDIVHELNKKNTAANIGAEEVAEMIRLGYLTVKFNVRRTDHGTCWQIDRQLMRQQLRLLCRPEKHKRQRQPKHELFL